MIRTTVSIANLHDGMALEAEVASMAARCLDVGASLEPECWRPELLPQLRAVIHLLHGRMRDGGEPGDDR